MSGFYEGIRYEYPLTETDVVVDVGAHRGDFAFAIANRYGCKVFALEPIKRFYDEMHGRRQEELKRGVIVFVHSGLGAKGRMEKMGVHGAMTGVFCVQDDSETVPIMSISKLLFGISGSDEPARVALLKLNCEGMEFEILEEMLNLPCIDLFDNLQIQWHNVFEGAPERRQKIIDRLSQTHRPTFDFEWVWQNWRRKCLP